MEKKREVGIDLLRILSMLGIVCVHILNNGGVLSSLDITNVGYYVVNMLTTIVYCSVNIFAMITGYLYINKKTCKINSIFNLIAIVIFYGVIIAIIFYIFNLFNIRSEGILDLIYSLCSSLSGTYWYITCYVLLFFMIPYINNFINNISKENLKKCLTTLFILISIITTLCCGKDLFGIENGYSTFWLIYCYMLGAYIKRYVSNENIKKRKLIQMLLISLFITNTLNYSIKFITYKIFGQIKLSEWFISYTSPFTVFNAAILLILFSTINIKPKKIISLLSLTSFDVYIIHAHIFIYNYVLFDRFKFLVDKNWIIILFEIILISTFIYVICSGIGILRKKLFDLLRIENVNRKISEKLDGLLNKIINDQKFRTTLSKKM